MELIKADSYVQHRGIENFKKFEDSLRNYSFFYPELKGASDIDFVYEKNNNLIIFEDKELHENKTIELFWGQYRMLKAFKNLNPNKVYLFFIFHRDNDYYMYEITQLDRKFNTNRDYSPNAKHQYTKKLDFNNEIPITKQDIKNQILKLAKTFER